MSLFGYINILLPTSITGGSSVWNVLEYSPEIHTFPEHFLVEIPSAEALSVTMYEIMSKIIHLLTNILVYLDGFQFSRIYRVHSGTFSTQGIIQ